MLWTLPLPRSQNASASCFTLVRRLQAVDDRVNIIKIAMSMGMHVVVSMRDDQDLHECDHDRDPYMSHGCVREHVLHTLRDCVHEYVLIHLRVHAHDCDYDLRDHAPHGRGSW